MLAAIGGGEGLFGGFVGLFVVVFLVVLGISWFILPFAVFGLKGRLDTLIALQRKQSDHVASLRVDLADLRAELERLARLGRQGPESGS
jgi:uncharacterized membrane protein